MADKNDFSELPAEMLLRMDRQQEQLNQTNSILRTVVQIQEKMLSTQEHMQQTQVQILDRLDRNEAGFNAFAGAVLDHLGGIRADLREIRITVYQDHEERLRRLEDFMRRAS
ncbi:hypothetical protein [Hymenobacter weizhouensis]|uniref:hypothetical protein n=1 Tax=Hymenobacter sp. YIM 151500-1 TaxID=2987689 RepID=UPI002226B8FD|nr:hypothetical protein [Hymenobacter sp. YIM 151500-1]UYZ62287.1 hypothetical protein OIS53_14955 [Hymenobacter sp. YIM 151500-1]